MQLWHSGTSHFRRNICKNVQNTASQSRGQRLANGLSLASFQLIFTSRLNLFEVGHFSKQMVLIHHSLRFTESYRNMTRLACTLGPHVVNGRTSVCQLVCTIMSRSPLSSDFLSLCLLLFCPRLYPGHYKTFSLTSPEPPLGCDSFSALPVSTREGGQVFRKMPPLGLTSVFPMVRWGYRCGEDAQRKVPCSRRRVEVHRQLTTGDADLGPWPRSCLPGLSSTNLPFSRFPTLSSVFGR